MGADALSEAGRSGPLMDALPEDAGRIPLVRRMVLAPVYAEAIDADIIPVAATILPYNVATDLDTLPIREVNR